ncbi:2'-5' RNA ligase family protein [Actinomadura luteofluorescens]|uniref:2'-5' RNA ligase family protein n=1 Tax=Actinomadura luteofluorescens TaxID=46163 RepID=UPI0034886249
MVADGPAPDAAEGPGKAPSAAGGVTPGGGGGARTIGVAIPIPDPYGAFLQARRASFGDPLAHAIPTHITLLPPTEVPESEVDAIEGHLRGVASTETPFPIRLRGSGTFRPVSPVVFVALAEGIGGCERVQAKVLTGPLARPLPFPYHPHVTIAHHLPESVMDQAFKELAGYSADFEAWGFSLYEHGRDGVWRPQCDFIFGDGAVPSPGGSRGGPAPG